MDNSKVMYIFVPNNNPAFRYKQYQTMSDDDDNTDLGHTKCLPVCLLTGTIITTNGYINIILKQ